MLCIGTIFFDPLPPFFFMLLPKQVAQRRIVRANKADVLPAAVGARACVLGRGAGVDTGRPSDRNFE